MYGLVPMTEEPAVVKHHIMNWHYKSLPVLGVNRNIMVTWCWIPWEYQGLGLPNMGLEKCSAMVRYLLHHWGVRDGLGTWLKRSFELTQIECGLKGNFLLHCYSTI